MPGTVIVVPCYNEAQRLDVRAFQSFARKHSEISFLFVDDGSTDDTQMRFDILRQGCSEQFRFRSLVANRGKAEAVRTGMLATPESAEFIGYLDADLAAPLESILALTASLSQNEQAVIAMGTRPMSGPCEQRATHRRFASGIFRMAAGWILGRPVVDTQCGAKVLRNCSPVRELFARPFLSRWCFDVEVLGRLSKVDKQGYKAKWLEVDIENWREKADSKLGLLDYFRAAFDLSRLFLIYRCRM